MPIGNRDNESKQYNVVVLNLDEEIYYLGRDSGIRKDEITAMCPGCGETVSQEENVCSGCNTPVAWMHSTVWRKLYGNPTTFLNSLQRPELLPKTTLEVRAVEAFGTGRQFAHVTQARTLRSLAKNYPEGYILDKMDWASSRHVGFHNFVKAVKNPDNKNVWDNKMADKGVVNDDKDAGDPFGGWGNPLARD